MAVANLKPVKKLGRVLTEPITLRCWISATLQYGATFRHLSSLCGVGHSTIYRFLRGHGTITPDTHARLSKLYELNKHVGL